MELSIFLYTNILNRKVYDEFGDVLGLLKDVYVTTEEGYPRIIGYKLKKDGVTFHYEFRYIQFIDNDGKIRMKTRGSKEILPKRLLILMVNKLFVLMILE